MSPVLVELCLLVSMQGDPIRAHEVWQTQARSNAAFVATAPAAALAGRRKEFEARFNRLTDALADFSREYNRNQGMAWPKDKADALKKAMRDLEKSEAWFQK